MNKETAIKIIGGNLSKVSKLPCYSYNIPAQMCNVGSKLVNVKGSTCSGCYALKGNYKRFPVIFKSMTRKLKAIKNKSWVQALAYLINSKRNNFFRWHDSGDLQSVEHLVKISRIAKLTPKVNHWLPTRELNIVNSFYKKGYKKPSNLCIRISAFLMNKEAKTVYDLPTSTVHLKGSKVIGKECPAPKTRNQCGNCRSCWNDSIKNISYKYH